MEQIESVAPFHASVVLAGESGTGKEEAAREIHRRSGREGRFLGINCAAFPEGIIESQLFGHERGAFTGAQEKHRGFFEQADHGTLFLDEITETSKGLQAKLLRALEERQVIPLGGSMPIGFDTRVIAASNRDLEGAVAERALRKDLFYRLNVVQIDLPPLRKRKEDIELLAEKFIAEFNIPPQIEILGLNEECRAALRAHSWPGNVRELRNAVQRAMIERRRGYLKAENLPATVRRFKRESEPMTFNVGMSLAELQREATIRTFRATCGNHRRAAKILGISPNTLYKALAKYGVEPNRAGSQPDPSSKGFS